MESVEERLAARKEQLKKSRGAPKNNNHGLIKNLTNRDLEKYIACTTPNGFV